MNVDAVNGTDDILDFGRIRAQIIGANARQEQAHVPVHVFGPKVRDIGLRGCWPRH